MSLRKQDTVALLRERVRREDQKAPGAGVLGSPASCLPHTRLGRGGGVWDPEPPLLSRGVEG